MLWVMKSSVMFAVDAVPMKIACVGDSLTTGLGASSVDHSYPAVLGTLLGAGYTVGNFGAVGATALLGGGNAYVYRPQFASSKSFEPDVVIIMLGTNDSSVSHAPFLGAFIANYSALIADYQNLPSHPTVICCLPPR
jgi:lysophospholipase L1-like esterase